MNHDELLSRYLDGELTPEEQLRVERDPALQKMLRLHELSDLPMTRADFTAEDLLVRAGRTRSRWSWAAAAAAVFLMAFTHAAAFLYGVERAEEPVASNAVGETEEILREMAALDEAAPHDDLQRRLINLRGGLQEHLPALAGPDIPETQRPRADQLVGHVGRLIVAYEQVEDAAFRAVALRKLANQALGIEVGFAFVPATARSYQRVTPLGEGRFRILVVRESKVLRDEGTVEELQTRNQGLRIRITGEDR